MSKITILLADDEQHILDLLKFYLENEGYHIITANNGEKAIELAETEKPELIILDVNMPYKNGLEVCNYLRAKPSFNQTLVIFLTALNDEESELLGLEAGADDYLTKPISAKVFVPKINALLRRVSPAKSDETEKIKTFGNLTIDFDRFIILVDNKEIFLPRKEFKLLALLASKPGSVFLRNEILEQVWGNDVIVGDRTIDVHIRKIRQKLNLDCISTIKGLGYKFDYQ